jgi:methylthioribulose-1-phosphate dehydratase
VHLETNIKEKLAHTIRAYNAKGWSPATSTNYSFKTPTNELWVSRSGIDKSLFEPTDFITVDNNGKPTGEYTHTKPSAETLIHCTLYELFPSATVILHSHSVFPLLASMRATNSIAFEGFELQKGFEGQTTHAATIHLPIFENTQDMIAFSNELRLNAHRLQHHAFIIRKHGTYAWGRNLFEAKRHLETLDYLCELQERMNPKDFNVSRK